MTEEQLKACEVGAPFMVAEYRKLAKEHEETCKGHVRYVNIVEREIELLKAYSERTYLELNNELIDENVALGKLVRSLLYTMRSGVLAISSVEELTNRAKNLGVWP